MPRMNPKATFGVVGSVAAAIIAAIIAVEGGFVDHKDDPGGPTKDGITQAVAREHGYTGDMRALPRETSVSIYNEKYIVKPGYSPFLEIAPAVAEELVDTGVNTGPDRGSRWLQTALNALSQQGQAYPQVAVDGQVGAQTVNAYKALQAARGKVQACQLVIKAMDAQQGAYYVAISTSNPKLQSFTAGWLAHRIGNVPLSKCAT